MAIKGRSKPKARRSVTPGPRPVYVPVKRPIVQRRGFQVGVLAVVVVVALGAIAYGFVHERNADHEAEQKALMARIASSYTTQVQSILSAVGQPQAVSFTLLPDLKTQIDALRKGAADPAHVADAAKTMQEQASGAAGDLAAIRPGDMIQGKGVDNGVFVDQVINSEVKMEKALRMDAVAAGVLRVAALGPASRAKALLDQADAATSAADDLFQSGYSDWSSAQVTAGTYQPASIGTGAGLPGGP